MTPKFDWIWLTFVFPVLIGFFKNEIGKLIVAYNVYRLRKFDLDGNAATTDEVELLNNATGMFEKVIVKKIVFSLSSKRRGVFLEYPGGEKEKISLVNWAEMRKRKLP